MKQMMASASASVVLNRLVIARFFLFSATTLFSAIMATLAGTNWAACDTQTKFLIVISVLSNWGGMILAFIDSSLKRAQEGKDPFTGATLQPFAIATQAQVDAGTSTKTIVTPATLAATLDSPPKP